MPSALRRYQECGDLHFITFSCHGRQPHLGQPKARDQFVLSLKTSQQKYCFVIYGFVVMPEHVHLLISEPAIGQMPSAIQAVKQSVTRRLGTATPFWYPRYYDFNIYSAAKESEKLDYMRFNPVKRGLCASPEAWPWSSATHPITPGAPPARSRVEMSTAHNPLLDQPDTRGTLPTKP